MWLALLAATYPSDGDWWVEPAVMNTTEGPINFHVEPEETLCGNTSLAEHGSGKLMPAAAFVNVANVLSLDLSSRPAVKSLAGKG